MRARLPPQTVVVPVKDSVAFKVSVPPPALTSEKLFSLAVLPPNTPPKM